MEFIELNQILNTDTDIELSVKNSDWSKVIRSITASTGWLNKSEFNSLFSPYLNQQVFAFETFERVSKKTGIKKRINSNFSLTWDNFDTFRKSTDILFLYLVSSKLNWVFYANRDQWEFSARPYQANQLTHCVRWDANTRGGCAIMPHMSAPVIGKLCAKRIIWNTVLY